MKKIVCFCVLLLAIVTGCGQATSPGSTSEIYGTVLDADGNPIENAKILVNFHIDSEYPIGEKFENNLFDLNNEIKGVDDPPMPVFEILGNYPNPFTNSTCIAFSLGINCTISVYIEDNSNQIVKTIIDSQLCSAGITEFNWNGKDNDNNIIKNGLEKVIFYIEDEIYSHTCFAFLDCNEVFYEDISPLCMSDYSGEFTIQSDDLPLNYVGDQYDENGNPVGDFTVTPYIDIWAFHPDYNAVHVDSIFVESGKDIHVSLSFE
ncbi:MAG: hypothetical protein RAP70_11215 [Candidatus Celaenobacter antarcticus]|nr:hypothetical protein [Candidatus Celaenobacter antarcticus]